jgi:hypothetical protein
MPSFFSLHYINENEKDERRYMNKRLFFTFNKRVENNRLRGSKLNFRAKKA